MKLLRVVWAVLGLWAALLSLAHDALPHNHSSASTPVSYHFHPWGEADPCNADHGHRDWHWLCDWLDHHASDIPNDDHHVGIWTWSGQVRGGDGALEDWDMMLAGVEGGVVEEWIGCKELGGVVRIPGAVALPLPGCPDALGLRGPPLG